MTTLLLAGVGLVGALGAILAAALAIAEDRKEK